MIKTLFRYVRIYRSDAPPSLRIDFREIHEGRERSYLDTILPKPTNVPEVSNSWIIDGKIDDALRLIR